MSRAVPEGIQPDLRLNRIGNLLVPNSNYCKFEDWVVPILDQMVKEQEGEDKTVWSPSKVIRRLGKEIDNEESVYYWCYKVSRFACSKPVFLDEQCKKCVAHERTG